MHKRTIGYAGAAALLQGLAACGGEAPTAETLPREVIAPATPVGDVDPPAASASPAAQGEERLVLAFGDSLYAGYGLLGQQALPAVLERRLDAAGVPTRVVNAGVSGDTSAAGRRRLAYVLDNLDRTPDLVLLGLGGNDMLRQIAPAETRANMTAMMDELRRRDVPVVLTGMLAPPNLGGDYARRFNAIWPDLAREYDAGLYPFILDGVIGDRALMLPDYVHPNRQGVERIAERIEPVVAERLAAQR